MPMRNAITGARACRAGLAGLALVILAGSLAEAMFGPRTTIGKNYQQWSDTQSANGINSGNCVDTFDCYVLFQPIPQQQALIVQHVACGATIIDGGLVIVSLRTRKGNFPLRRTPLVPVSTTANVWVVNSPVMHLVKPLERPIVYFQGSEATVWQVACSISGRLQ